jgi:pentapeptide MXKDX repeat protein
MKTFITAVAMLGLTASASFAQSGANPSAPQPSSTGAGVNQPGTTSTGTAVDRPDSMKKDGMSGTTGMKKDGMAKDGMSKDGMKK